MTTFRWLFEIFSSMEAAIYFQIGINVVTATFQVSVNTYFLNFRLALLWLCLLIVLRALVYLIKAVIFNNFLVLDFSFFNLEH